MAEKQGILPEEVDVLPVRKGMKMADYVLGKLNRGVTDMPARAGRFDRANLGQLVRRDEAAYGIAKGLLAQAGVEIDSYSRYEGSLDFSDRIAVIAVGDQTIEPSQNYARELAHGQTVNARVA